MCVLFGVAAVLPWNALVAAMDIFETNLPDYKPSSLISFIINGCLLLMSVINTLYGHHFSYNFKISVTNLMCAIFMIPIPFIAVKLEKDVAFWIEVALVTIVGISSGIAESSTLSLGGMMPSTHMGGIMLGFAISGFLANIVRIIVLLSLPDNMLLSSVIYFSIGGVLLMLASFAHWRF